jgi:acetylcholinesterase
VTIFGESAGGLSVDVLVTSFATKAPFRAAIEESGQGTYRALVPDPHKAWNTLAAAVGCNTTASALKCMRGLPASTLKNSSEHLGLAFTAMVDNYTFVANRSEARASGKIAKVPVLAGTNADEGTVFTYGDTNLTAYLAAALPTAPQSYLTQLTSAYAIGSPGIANVSQQIAKIYTEFSFQCTQARELRDTKRAGMPTWRSVLPTLIRYCIFPGPSSLSLSPKNSPFSSLC